jgi:pyrimidine operon attenuation protein / uracil phosphoribosyltransferase
VSERDESLIEKRELLDSAGIARALKRMAHEMVERNAAVGAVVLVGIRTAGVPLAERLAALIDEAGEIAAKVGAIDITLYRDDVFEGLPKPEVGSTTLPEHTIAGKTVILVDDVLFTGRTIRAALDALMDYGRPRSVQLAVLIDRGHRELPIQPDYVGLKVETTRQQSVKLILDGRERAVLREKR